MSMLPATTPSTRVLDDTDEQIEPPYHLILLDDNEHTYGYVVHMLGSIFGYGREKAFAIACVVDSEGQAILMTGAKGELELKQEAVHAFGADPSMPECKGSMTAVLEPAE
ncbi:MAG TPA: ATP-dependent Clp protease adaptor ClpS [Tepidiformaceae bacterium]|nr:ATP-dependent Clp protease adaptor ClpS [Tepidiformaceae bacterium]HMO95893.1 ATP-dependent Clp protease adaptor ClpS [Tepidiformaceae bacterium]